MNKPALEDLTFEEKAELLFGTQPAADEQELAKLHNGRLILKGAQLLFEHDPEKPLYPKYATVSKRHNRHERRQMEVKLEAAKKRARKATKKAGQK